MIVTTENEGISIHESDGAIIYDGPDDVTMTILPGEIAELDIAMEEALQKIQQLFNLLRQIRAQRPRSLC